MFGRLIHHGVHIQATNNKGFVVKVGCQQFAFEGIASLKAALCRYLDDPYLVEAEFRKVFELTAEPITPRAREHAEEIRCAALAHPGMDATIY